MQPHKHSHIFRETDIDRTIAKFGNKPSRTLKNQMMESLRKERGKFRQIENYRAQSNGQSQGQSI